MDAVLFILTSAVRYITMIFNIRLPNMPSYGMMLMFAFFLGFFIMCLFGLTRREINGALNDTYQARREERDQKRGKHVFYKPKHGRK